MALELAIKENSPLIPSHISRDADKIIRMLLDKDPGSRPNAEFLLQTEEL